MKRKSIALLLALMMCLALLSACGGNSTADTKESPASGNTSSPTGQEPADGKEEQPAQEPEQEEPTQDEPEESEEPAPEETALPEHEGTKFLALLQEEWKNGFVEGERANHTYLDFNNRLAVVYNGVVYIQGGKVLSYDIASKEVREAVSVSLATSSAGSSRIDYTYYSPNYFLDGNFYFLNIQSGEKAPGETIAEKTEMYDCDGAFLNSFQGEFDQVTVFEQGILAKPFSVNSFVLLSHDLEKIAEIPAPQHEVGHGLSEELELRFCRLFAANGTVYLSQTSDGESYRLNADTYEWESVELPSISWRYNITEAFCGKYRAYDKGIYDCVTGEEVFNWEKAGVYPPLSGTQYHGQFLCYFGGDKYIGFKDHEYRWVNLTDLTMSDPLPFPPCARSYSHEMTILNDTHCVYYDDYGWFLWNYNTGEEETIVLFDQ